PGVHQPTPFIEQIAPPIGGLHLILHFMRQRHLGHIGWKIRALGSPISEGAAKAVDGYIAIAHTLLKKIEHRHVAERSSRIRHGSTALRAWKHERVGCEIAIANSLPHRRQNIDCGLGQRHTVLPCSPPWSLHSLGRNRPELCGEVELTPFRTDYV